MITPFTSADIWIVACCIAFLASAFLGSGKFRLGQIIRYYGLQSLAVAGLLTSLGVFSDEYVFISAMAVVLFKVMLIPLIVSYSAGKAAVSGRLSATVKASPSYFISGLMLLFAVLAGMQLAPTLQADGIVLTVTAFAGMFLGGAMMALRQDLYSQIIGFLTLENGITVLAAGTLGILPLLAEFGILFVITLGALLMSSLARRLKELYAVEDTSLLSELVE